MSPATLNKIADVPTGKKPDAIIYDPATSRVFAFNGGGNSATAIAAATGKVEGTVDLGGGSEFGASDGKGFVFNNLEDESLVLKINAKELKVEQRWPTAPCASPSIMAMDRTTRRLFLGCRNKVMAVMNADTGKVITTLPIGDHVDTTAFDVDSGLIFNSNGEGILFRCIEMSLNFRDRPASCKLWLVLCIRGFHVSHQCTAAEPAFSMSS